MTKPASRAKKPRHIALALALAVVLFAVYILSLSIGDYLKSLEAKTGQIQPYKNLLEALGGFKGPQKNLLLLANNAELRMGGGFVGTVGMVGSDKGKVTSEQLVGVYAIDVYNDCSNKPYSPPDYLKGIGPCASLRDSSNQLDFPQNAKQALYYYQQTVKRPVDNVVQFTPSVLEILLEKLGPVYLKDYDLTVSKENFRDTVQLEVEAGKDKVELKDPKSGILGSLANQLITKLISKDVGNLASLLPLLKQMVEEKQIVLYSTNQDTQKLIEQIGASGEVKKSDENYFMLAEANIGANKSSPYLKNRVDMHQTVNQDGSSTIELSIDSEHTSDYKIKYIDPNIPGEQRWLVGDNFSYVKLALPSGSKLVSSSLPQDGLVLKTELDKLTLGYYRTTLPLKTSKVSFSYTVPTKYIFSDQLVVSTFIQKQLGGWPYELHYSLSLATDSYQLQAASSSSIEITNSGGVSTLSYDKIINSDQSLSFIYAKK
ncbi:MAG: DUF4012 domain-containing protein [Candidatus Saccharibacteria bacterium]